MKTLELAKKLIEFKTINNNNREFKNIYKFIKTYIHKINKNLYIEAFESNKYESVLITPIKDKRKFELLLAGHIDVVPAPDKLFKPKIKAGKLIGRGAADMKSAVAIMLNSFKNNDNQSLLLTSDEEIGGANGVKYIIEKQNLSSKCVFLPDGKPNWKIVLEEKGFYHCKFEAFGKSSHGARPWLGKNAADLCINFYQDLKSIFNKSYPISECEDDGNNSISLGKIDGGEATNQVPKNAEILVDFRFNSKVGKEGMEKFIQKVLDKHPSIKLKTSSFGETMKVNKTSKYIKRLENILKEEKIDYGFQKEAGASDARHFPKDTDVVMLLPTGGNTHEDNEWIDIKEFDKFEKVVNQYIKTFCA